MVPSQRLLVFGRAEDGNVTHFIQLVHGVLEGCLSSLFIVRPDPWRSIVEVSWEDSLRTIDHEDWCIAGGKLCDPSSAKLVQPLKDPRHEAL